MRLPLKDESTCTTPVHSVLYPQGENYMDEMPERVDRDVLLAQYQASLKQDSQWTAQLEQAALLNPRIFFDADLDSDDIVTSSEMLVLIVENIAALQPANRDNLPLQLKWQIGPIALNKTVTLHVAFAGPLA